MKKTSANGIPGFTTIEEEKEYWESQGLLNESAKAKNNPKSGTKRASFLNIRLSGEEITQLRDLAARTGMGPSTLARTLIKNALNVRQTNGFREYSKPEDGVLFARDADRLNNQPSNSTGRGAEARDSAEVRGSYVRGAETRDSAEVRGSYMRGAEARDSVERGVEVPGSYARGTEASDRVALVDLGKTKIDFEIVKSLFETLQKACQCALLGPQEKGYSEIKQMIKDKNTELKP